MKKYQVTLRTSDFRGDHSADIEIGIDVPPETTVGELFDNIFGGITQGFLKGNVTDWLIIRPTHLLKDNKEEMP